MIFFTIIITATIIILMKYIYDKGYDNGLDVAIKKIDEILEERKEQQKINNE